MTESIYIHKFYTLNILYILFKWAIQSFVVHKERVFNYKDKIVTIKTCRHFLCHFLASKYECIYKIYGQRLAIIPKLWRFLLCLRWTFWRNNFWLREWMCVWIILRDCFSNDVTDNCDWNIYFIYCLFCYNKYIKNIISLFKLLVVHFL